MNNTLLRIRREKKEERRKKKTNQSTYMKNTLSKLNGISVCVGFLISLEMKKEERRQTK